MGGLAEEYYSLAWRAVREGPEVLEEVFGPSATLRSCYEAARRSQADVAERFAVIACYLSARLISEIIEIVLDDPNFCNMMDIYTGEVRTLALKLKRDILDEEREYNLSTKTTGLAKALLDGLIGILKSLEGYCGNRAGETKIRAPRTREAAGAGP